MCTPPIGPELLNKGLGALVLYILCVWRMNSGRVSVRCRCLWVVIYELAEAAARMGGVSTVETKHRWGFGFALI